MKVLSAVSFIAAALVASVSLAHTGTTECIPKNNLLIPESMNFSGITKEEFMDVLDKVEKVYAPIIEEHGATLDVVRSWDDDTVNAQAWQTGKTWHIEMFGGLARHEETTVDGMALVACHELGHHVGGMPRQTWASNEGQSDYYGSLKCLRKVWAKDDNQAIVAKLEIPKTVSDKCSSEHKNANDAAICMRGSLAGMALGRLLGSLGGQKMPKFETPDSKIVKKTNHAHPRAQCRLDTYFAGSVCKVEHTVDVSNTDAEVGVCSRKFGETAGVRPLCWFFDPAADANRKDEVRVSLVK